MKIDFSQAREEVIEGFNGGKGSITLRRLTKNGVTFIKAELAPHSSVGMHKHMADCEIIHIVSGKGKVICDGETEIVTAGTVTFCPVGYSHSLINDSDQKLEFIGIVPVMIGKR